MPVHQPVSLEGVADDGDALRPGVLRVLRVDDAPVVDEGEEDVVVGVQGAFFQEDTVRKGGSGRAGRRRKVEEGVGEG